MSRNSPYEGKLIAGRWRVVAELEQREGQQLWRVTNSEGVEGELQIIPPDELSQKLDAIKRLDALKHDNILKPLEAGTWTDYQYLVRELPVGQTVKDQVWRDDRLSYDQTLGIACQLCLALSELSRMADIDYFGFHPENILVDPQGFVKIDPLAVNSHGDDPQWQSPEELRGLEPDSTSDVFRIGLLIRYMLTGKKIDRDSHGGVTGRKLHEQFKDVPVELDGALERILHVNPSERVADVDALLDILHPLLMNQKKLTFTTEAGAEPTGPDWSQDSRFWLYIALGLVGLLGLIFAFNGILRIFTG